MKKDGEIASCVDLNLTRSLENLEIIQSGFKSTSSTFIHTMIKNMFSYPTKKLARGGYPVLMFTIVGAFYLILSSEFITLL